MVGLRWPTALTLHVWTLKRLILVFGSVLSIGGSLGSQFYIDPLQKLSSSLDGAAKDGAAKVQILQQADAQYWSFFQQSATVFGLGVSDSSPEDVKDTIAKLHRLTVTSGRRSMISVIAQLAIAGELDYRSTSDQHEKLLIAERDDFTWNHFQALNDFERTIMQRAEARIGSLQSQVLALVNRKSTVDADLDRHKLNQFAVLTLGSFLLLLANLMSTREPRSNSVDKKAASAEDGAA